MGSEVEKIGVRGRKNWGQRSKNSGRLGQASVPEANWGQRWSGEDEGFYAKGSKVKSFSVRVLYRRALLLNKRIALMVKDLY